MYCVGNEKYKWDTAYNKILLTQGSYGMKRIIKNN